jgi:hypothetical protein
MSWSIAGKIGGIGHCSESCEDLICEGDFSDELGYMVLWANKGPRIPFIIRNKVLIKLLLIEVWNAVGM